MKEAQAPAPAKVIKENQGSPFSPQRVASVDAYRGFVMLLMMAEVLSFRHVSESLPDSSFWRFLYFNQDHVPWVGCSLHDMIQPSFSFLVGVALPYSIASRRAKGIPFNSMLLQALKRSLILIVLGIFLRSLYANQTYFTFEDTLSQIGLGYTFLFLLGFQSQRVQIIACAVIVVGYWLAFALYPVSPDAINPALTGVPVDWEHNLRGFAEHWNKNSNLAWDFDRWFLNLFPREKTFLYNEGGYSTLSFIPTLGTMILGLIAGNTLRSNQFAAKEKARRFVIIGVCLVAAALLVHFTGINPIVKRIWTPAWVLFSGGISFLFLSAFYWIIDINNRRRWAFILMVIGMNSIAAYVIADGFGGFIQKTLYTHLGQHYDQLFGDAYSTLVKGLIVLTIEWLILYWMNKKKIFIKI
jgi:predicted acyltransferase